ncbi:MAG TPA: hypothetical protein PLM53_20120 [Spirochaetota bacterium]|nr:hypothetical protein [Spirochaetota bacterium]HPC43089.1 hypothetical protein [Spirochaetota bacterium]HPL17193.1 hypothetical protein [Spirochaetota bacterium]HQF07161.1 hypothetical protein [Spirochaetota bacterium]HQH99401.1 hypothetical protein [Spirochaetota bacterium]
MKKDICTGILTRDGGTAFIVDSSGKRHFEDETIWEGYMAHWLGTTVNARHLPQRDYRTGRNILILWPYREPSKEPYVELYYNERLVKYPLSFVGHLAVNVNGAVFNFSHLINENEIISEEEYFYRPALGEFAPDPLTGRFNVADPERPYYDKFGRNFMRTIHVLRITGLDTVRLRGQYEAMVREILGRPDPRRPEKYRDFNIITRSCVTFIRDGLRRYGFTNLGGVFPRDFFINASYHFLKIAGRNGLGASLYLMPQLMVPEAPRSALTVIANPVNWFLARKLPDR